MKQFYAGGFLYNPQTKKVLLHKRDNKTKFNPNKWAFFGGLNEGNETPKQTFIRELEEEIGLKVKTEKVIALVNYLNEELNTYRYVFYVQSQANKSELQLGEGAGFEWVPIKDLGQRDLTEKTKNDLQFFKERLNLL